MSGRVARAIPRTVFDFSYLVANAMVPRECREGRCNLVDVEADPDLVARLRGSDGSPPRFLP
jgi:hypothetical protein